MQTKLGRICDALIEAGWLAALIATPLFFNTSSNRVFEPDKLHLLRSIALVMAVAWIVQLIDAGLAGRSGADAEGKPVGLWAAIRRTPLVLPSLLLVAVYLISTALSVVPRISLFGSYVRMQGTYTFISYVLIFFMVVTHLRTRGQLNRIFYAVILTSLPIAIYCFIQHLGRDPLPWGGDVTERVAANMGNAIFVAAYLIIAWFLTLERLIDSAAALLSEEKGTTADALRAGAYLFILIVQAVAIVFTQSRGPWLGWAAGLYVFGLMGVLLLGRWAARRRGAAPWLANAVRPFWAAIIALTVAGLAFLVVFNLPNSPLSHLRQQRFIGRFGTLLSTTEGTNAVRVLIWEGVVDMMLKPHPPIAQPDGTPDLWNPIRPLIGYGPESMWVAYNRFYPPDLAHYEARNASPDRSHNETFDALVRTGLLGLGVQMWLYVSIFYYALRWLGLIQNARRRNLFLALLGGGALLGILAPLIADHSLRLAGIALPAGLIVGLVVYVTVDLWLVSAKGSAAEADAAGPTVASIGGGRRQLLILALLAAIIAHFVEIHFGIAIASTLTTFWTLAGVLVVVGMGWVREAGEQVEVVPALPAASGAVATRKEAHGLASAGRPAGAASPSVGKQKAGGRRSGGRPVPAPTGRREAERSAAVKPVPAARRVAASPLATFLPYIGIGAVITLILTWDYLINQTGAQAPLDILWRAFTLRVDNATFRVVQSPMLLILMIFTWFVGALLAVTEHRRLVPAGRSTAWIANALVYLITVIGVWLIYGLFHAGRLSVAGMAGLAVFHHVASHILVFDLILFALMVLLAAAIALAYRRPWPSRFSQGTPLAPLAVGLVAGLVAVAVILSVNIRTVQADTYYKQGLAYENAGAWDGAVVLHLEAARLEPEEDFYYLFLGRSLLQLASSQQVGSPSLPAEVSEQLSYPELLGLIERGARSRNREDLMRASYIALLTARQLNPYNTDHSANLARHNRSWAFTDALGPNDAPTNALLRQLVATQAKGVNMERLQRSLTYYRQATSLSPNNAGLWNELATTQFIMGDTEGALASLKHSEELDPLFVQTHIYRGDMFATLGDRAAALAAYRRAAELAGDDAGVLSAVGVYSAQMGDYAAALEAFRRLAEIQLAGLNSTQQQLADLNAQVSRLGGYSALLPTAAQRRDALQNSIPGQRSQLHLTYRNMALVLRDAGRTADALEAARSALAYASDAERPTIEALIAELQKKVGG